MRRLSGLGFLSGLNWHHVGVVARKELLDTLRDRRTWVAMIVMPLVIIPVMLLLAPSAVESQIERIERTTFRVAVVGDEEAESLVAALEATPGLELVGSRDPEADLGAGRLHAVLYLPAGFDAAVAAERPVQVEVAFEPRTRSPRPRNKGSGSPSKPTRGRSWSAAWRSAAWTRVSSHRW